MPTYCYEKPNGEIIGMDFPMGMAPESIPIGLGYNQIAIRSYQAEAARGFAFVKGSSNPVKRTYPMAPCVASGVHPYQAQELRDHLSDRGCPTEVTKGGDPIYISAAHRRKAFKIRKIRDKASYC